MIGACFMSEEGKDKSKVNVNNASCFSSLLLSSSSFPFLSFPTISVTTPLFLPQCIPNSFVPLSLLLPTFEKVRVMTRWKADSAPPPPPRCQSIYIKSTVHEITSLKDWTVDGDALGYCLLALSKKRGGEKRYNVTIADLALTLVTCVSINQSILLYYPSWRDIESKYMNKPSNINPSWIRWMIFAEH